MVPANREESTARDDLAVSDELKDVSQGALRWCRVRITHDVNMTSLHGHCACVKVKAKRIHVFSGQRAGSPLLVTSAGVESYGARIYLRNWSATGPHRATRCVNLASHRPLCRCLCFADFWAIIKHAHERRGGSTQLPGTSSSSQAAPKASAWLWQVCWQRRAHTWC